MTKRSTLVVTFISLKADLFLEIAVTFSSKSIGPAYSSLRR